MGKRDLLKLRILWLKNEFERYFEVASKLRLSDWYKVKIMFNGVSRINGYNLKIGKVI